MAPSTALIFTTHFPWEGGEIFFESELKVLAPEFDQVVLFPFEPKGQAKEMPQNVETCLLTPLPPGKGLRLNIFLRNAGSIFSLLVKDFWFENHKWKCIKQLRRNFSYMVYFHGVADRLEKVLRERGWEKQPLFSYWCIDWATVFVILRRRGFSGPMLSGLHAYDLYEEQNVDHYIRFRQLQFRAIDWLLPVSEVGRRYLQEKWPAFAAKYKIRRLGVHDHGLNPWNPGAVFTIVSCSNTEPHKRVIETARSIALLPFPVRWIHFGSGSQQAELEQIVAAFPPHIRAELRGNTANAQIMSFYQQEPVHLFLHLSQLEGVPVALMEAISFGIPVMGCENAGGMAEIVTAQTGMLIPHQVEAAAVARSIAEFKASGQNSEAFRAGVRIFWHAHFNADRNYRWFARQLKQAAWGKPDFETTDSE